MRITKLPCETFDELCFVLEKETTINWEKVMTEGFSSLYSQKHVEEIGQKRSPAHSLLNDLADREVPLEDLLLALQVIGNEKAISIINKGKRKNEEINHNDGWPSPQSTTREPEENSTSPSFEELAETLLPYPFQESSAYGGHPCHQGTEAVFADFICMMLLCMHQLTGRPM
ncbi:uncharacterized protein [Montipora foliosa]|uniref:uncharacterized protein n=1 Tax=Montipora foliosa TaxID=591990 RepID=UPI0035F1209E